MKPGQDLFSITSEIISSLKSVFEKIKPDIVLVHGDTTTSMAASISAFYSKIPVAHVEAGLRTNDLYSPFPEEINRQITSRIAVFIPPTEESQNNLAESIDKERIFITGNTIIDSLIEIKSRTKSVQFSSKTLQKVELSF